MPLAPGQKRLISIIDWERREEASQDENSSISEDLSASLGRDRDVSEVVKGALTESSRGGSSSTTSGVGVGIGAAGNGSYQGFNFGALLGISGGYGEANSNAWQDSARNASADSLQRLRDRTMQSASALRSQRASVVRAVRQGEAVRATTEVIANHNHCHAMTVQYFEVLRHLKLTQELVNVQECLFVPLPMTTFDLAKTLRWRNELAAYLKRPALSRAFDAARRVQTNWADVDYPNQQYADERVDSISGEFLLTVIVSPPPFPERPRPRPEDTLEQAAKAVNEATNPTTGALGILLAVATGGASLVAGLATNAAINATLAASKGARALAEDYYAEPDPQRRHDRFYQEVAPGVVESFVNLLSLEIKIRGQLPVRIDHADFTLVSSYQVGAPLAVSLRANLDGRFKRSDIEQIVLKSTVPLPASFRAIVNSAHLSYRTQRFEHRLVDDPRVNDDLESPVATAVFTNLFDLRIDALNTGQQRGVTLYAPLDQWEQLNPRNEDRRLTGELIEHLNDNFEYYHHAIWWTMDPNRRYMLLDGYYAPGSENRSVASVVENRLIGIVGNSLILPVAAGVRLDPRFRPDKNGEWIDLLGFYQPPTPVPATRISLPTKGVFAEAVMGNCNSCEEIDESRFWRWEQSPIDEAPAINALSTDSRRADTASLQAKDMPAPLVAIQTSPTAPEAGGVKVVLDALGKSVFTDITGLEGTQKNAAAAYQQALDSAYKFGKEASTLAQQAAMLNSLDKSMSAIDKAEAGGKIDKDKAKSLRSAALEKIVGASGDAASDPEAIAKRLGVIADAVDHDAISADDGRDHSNAVLRGISGDHGTQSDDSIGGLIKRLSPESASHVEARTADGASVTVEQPASVGGTGGGPGGILGHLLSMAMGSTSARRPGVARALVLVNDFSLRTGASAWPHLNRTVVARQLARLVTDPDTLNQGALGLCGPAIFLNCWLQAEPDSFVSYATGLFEHGHGRIGDTLIEPDEGLTTQDYKLVRSLMAATDAVNPIVPQAEWMVMSALQDHDNVLLDYEGTPAETLSDGVQDISVTEWLRTSQAFSSVVDATGNTSMVDALALTPTATRLIILVVDADMLNPSEPLFLFGVANHFIALRSKITTVGTTSDVTFTYWTWGRVDTITMSEERFLQLFSGGAIIAEMR